MLIALDFVVKSDISVGISNITIQKCRDSKSVLISLAVYETSSGFNFKNFTFKDNLVCASYGGGACIWIESGNRQKIFNFAFIECSFIGNRAESINFAGNHQGYGGALQLGNTPESSNFFYTVTNCTFDSNIADKYGGGMEIEPDNTFICENCLFINNTAYKAGGAIFIFRGYKSTKDVEVKIIECTFENNNLNNSNSNFINGNAIYVDTPSQLYITNSIFTNCGTDNEKSVMFFVGEIILLIENKIEFTQENNGTCGIDINSFSQIELTKNALIKCYSKGFGGGIRINASEENSSINSFKDLILDQCCSECGGAIYINQKTVIKELEFENCTFKKNKSFQHGGAILLQIINSIIISDCLFEDNSVNNHDLSPTKSELLYKKIKGRGGAIFINLSFSEPNENDNLFIQNCTFKSNSAYDGFGIYIEGYERGESIIIKENIFFDNYKTKNDDSEDFYSTQRSVITSEIFYLYDGKVLAENSFINSDSKPMNMLQYVDHHGNPIIEPTKYFSPSHEFTKSDNFSSCTAFPTKSHQFSSIIEFTKSYQFSLSHKFTESNQFVSNQQLYSNNNRYVGIACGIVSIILLIIVVIVIKRQNANEIDGESEKIFLYSFDNETDKIKKRNKEKNQNHNYNEANVSMNIISNDSALEIFI